MQKAQYKDVCHLFNLELHRLISKLTQWCSGADVAKPVGLRKNLRYEDGALNQILQSKRIAPGGHNGSFPILEGKKVKLSLCLTN
jgi:hypothetical protein